MNEFAEWLDHEMGRLGSRDQLTDPMKKYFYDAFWRLKVPVSIQVNNEFKKAASDTATPPW